jgi:hypothetical protein
MSSYIYKGEPESRVFGAIPAGDYNFIVASAAEPYTSKSGNLVLPLRLTILPQDIPVFANPWCGEDSSGNQRDGIAEFLLCVNRAPKVGEEPDWDKLVGARGKCRIKVEIAQAGALAGKEVNKVAFFHRPKQVGPTPTDPQKQSYSPDEFAKTRKEAAQRAGAPSDLEPEDIPF